MPGDLRPLCRCVARAFRELAGTIDRDRKRSWLRRDIVTLLRAAAEIEETRATCPCGSPSSPAPETAPRPHVLGSLRDGLGLYEGCVNCGLDARAIPVIWAKPCGQEARAQFSYDVLDPPAAPAPRPQAEWLGEMQPGTMEPAPAPRPEETRPATNSSKRGGMTVAHLWDEKHPYYCNEGNYFHAGMHNVCASWADFKAEMGEADEDLNLVYRWDWEEPTTEDCGGESEDGRKCPDPCDGTCGRAMAPRLKLFYMQQRKAKALSFEVSVRPEDEPEIRAWLEKKWRHMQRLWAPISAASSQREDGGGRS